VIGGLDMGGRLPVAPALANGGTIGGRSVMDGLALSNVLQAQAATAQHTATILASLGFIQRLF
jgi:hypothetical protein